MKIQTRDSLRFRCSLLRLDILINYFRKKHWCSHSAEFVAFFITQLERTELNKNASIFRNYTGPTRGSTEFKTSSMKNFTRTAAQETHNAALDLDEDSHSRMFVSDTRRTNFLERDMEDSEVSCGKSGAAVLVNLSCNF